MSSFQGCRSVISRGFALGFDVLRLLSSVLVNLDCGVQKDRQTVLAGKKRSTYLVSNVER